MFPIDYMYYMRPTTLTREEAEKMRALVTEIVELFPDLKFKWIARAPRRRQMPEIRMMTKAEWLAEVERRFGPDPSNWRFVCPTCGNIQGPPDFEPYKDKGATPDSCTKECLGRYLPDARERDAFDSEKGGPCNYAAYGLIQLAPIRVIDRDEDNPTHCFDFAPE
jgi:hypothetical protein